MMKSSQTNLKEYTEIIAILAKHTSLDSLVLAPYCSTPGLGSSVALFAHDDRASLLCQDLWR